MAIHKNETNGNASKDGPAPPAPKIVGPNITGKREEYRLERRLQSGLFGGVYEAKGLSSGQFFAVKVLHRSELHKAQRASSLEFCEVPLSEIKFSDVMRGHDHVMQVEDNFEDQYCHYIVFSLARGGDLLEALKLRPTGFEEQQAQFLIGQAARGLSVLHERRLAMQDVSLENMLLDVLDNGEYRVKICDPGQAVLFEVDEHGEEVPVKFHGFVGKSFRPPEIHSKQPYSATQVDAWCLGWSTFYLLAAQPLFLSADPIQQDPDWELFQNMEYAALFRQKATSCSQSCIDFILRLLQIDPKKRMTINEALQHDWLRDSNSKPMFAPKELMPSPLTPDKRVNDSRSEEFVRRPAGVTPGGEAGISSPNLGGGPNKGDEMRVPGQGNSGYRSGGLTGSLGGPGGPQGGLSAGGHFNSGGGPGGLGTSGDRRYGQSGVAPAWKMAPPSRSESPGPGGPAPMVARPYYQGGGSAGAPTPTQYAPVQGRTSSPFGSGTRGYVSTMQGSGRSLSPPPRQGAGMWRGNAGTNVYGGTADRQGASALESIMQNLQMVGGSQNSHTPRPSRTSAVPPGRMGGSAAADSMDYGGHSPQLSAAPSEQQQLIQGLRSDEDMNGNLRYGAAEMMGGSGRLASSIGGGPPGARTSSPMPQASVVLRPHNVRGLSPSPMRSMAGLDASWIQQRSASPMQQHGGSGAAAPGGAAGPGATRGISGQTAASVDAVPGGAGHYWTSPRTASPSASVFRQPEVYPRGRSHTRAMSPSQPGGAGAYASSNAVGLTRTMSPSGGLPGRAGIAWSPVPPSPPAPKRSISPQPSSVVVGHNNSVSSLRWGDVQPQMRR